MLGFVFSEHLRLAAHSALLFIVGLFVSWPVVHYELKAVARPPLAIFRGVLKLLGPSPSILRMMGLIFSFNGVALFAYMATGFHPLLPKLLAIWTGMNIGIIIGMGADEADLISVSPPTPSQWVPSPGLAVACAPIVLLLEMPCVLFTIAMGISMGHAVQSGVAYSQAFAVRAGAYLSVVLPLLVLSALAEAVAIRGSAAHTP